MFKILAGDYGNPPLFANFVAGTIQIAVSPEIEKTFKGFNNRDKVFGTILDELRGRDDVTKIEIVDKESYEKDGLVQFINTVGGASYYGPAGVLLGKVGNKRTDILFFVETRVGNSFIAKADEKVFKKIQNKLGPTDEQRGAEAFNQIKASRGNNLNESKVDLISELEKLGSLKEKGLLSDEEFSTLKSDLLNRKKNQDYEVLETRTTIESDSSWVNEQNQWQQENKSQIPNNPIDANADAVRIISFIVILISVIVIIVT